jgi:transposase
VFRVSAAACLVARIPAARRGEEGASQGWDGGTGWKGPSPRCSSVREENEHRRRRRRRRRHRLARYRLSAQAPGIP